MGFSPDLLWFKSRSTGGAGYNNIVFDSVRGSSKSLATDITNGEFTGTDLTSFNSDGFTLAAPNQWFGVNNNGTSFVAWTWDAGNTTVTDNTGSIQSTRRTNASAGFSVVGWSYPSGTPASTIGHGLGVKPGLIILKSRPNTYNWMIYHSAVGATKTFRFNTQAVSTESDPWNNTEPTSSVFSIGAASWHGTGDMIAYCFAPVAGYSSIGSFVGNSSAEGPFVYTGFRVRWLMVKNADATTDWVIVDTARETYNVVDDFLRPNSSAAEGTRANLAVDLLSNGFKLRGLDNFMNGSNTHVYLALAESPFQYARAR